MDKLDAMQTIVAIADAGTLTAAARARGKSLPSVVRTLALLEAELGARLFQRTTRKVALTDAGRSYLARCREVQALVSEAEAELRSEQSEPRGNLTLTAPVLFGQRHVASGVVDFVSSHPRVSVDLRLLDRVVSLLDEGIDVGIRIGALDDSSLVTRAVGRMRRLTVAAPAYLKRHGAPDHPRDLAEHNCVRHFRDGPTAWAFQVGGRTISVAVKGNLSVNQAAVAADACVAGLGIGTFAAYQVASQLRSGALQTLLTDFEPDPLPVHVVYPHARLLPARTRAFIEHIRAHLAREQSAWQVG